MGLFTTWRTTKQRIHHTWKQQQRKRQHQHPTHNRAVAHTPTAPSYQYDNQGNVTPTNGGAQAVAGRPPPPDGAIATCRRCSNEVQYNAGRERWEHTHHGNWQCFQPHRT